MLEGYFPTNEQLAKDFCSVNNPYSSDGTLRRNGVIAKIIRNAETNLWRDYIGHQRLPLELENAYKSPGIKKEIQGVLELISKNGVEEAQKIIIEERTTDEQKVAPSRRLDIFGRLRSCSTAHPEDPQRRR